MSKHKRNMILSAALMIIAAILTVRALLDSSEFKAADVASQLGLFLFGAHLFYLNYKNEQKRKTLYTTGPQGRRGGRLTN